MKINKYFLVVLVGIALGLGIVWPIAGLIAFSSFSLWEVLGIYAIFILPAVIGLLLLVNVWGTFEIKEAARK